ncbi:hypothetical protein [Capnocytophaga canis]|uniref:hypothetical protein n=1 Tax=Capnocytophaga canis TaxID=1848903 RepID=UPI0037D73580
MQGISEFIIEFTHTHKTSVNVLGVEMKINPYFEQPKHINRVGKVISVPLTESDCPIAKGDEVLIIHTVLLDNIFSKTGRITSNYLIDKNKNWARVEDSLVVAYRKNESERWTCYKDNVLIQPIPVEQKQKQWRGLNMPETVFEEELGYKNNQKQVGKIAFGNDLLKNISLNEGDTVVFKQDREYEFEIDNQTYYHMNNCDILLKIS